MTTVFHARPYGRFIDIQSNLRGMKPHGTNQGSNFLGGSFSNRNNIRGPIKFRRERQAHLFKRLFFLKNRPIHFHIYSTNAIRLFKRNRLSFSSIEINKPFLLQFKVSLRSDSSSADMSSFCHRSYVWSHFE